MGNGTADYSEQYRDCRYVVSIIHSFESGLFNYVQDTLCVIQIIGVLSPLSQAMARGCAIRTFIHFLRGTEFSTLLCTNHVRQIF